MSESGYIAVDLDGTLAEYGQWQGADHIGKPIPKMVARVKQWLSEGKNVKIFTARVYPIGTLACNIYIENGIKDICPEAIAAKEVIEKWCLEHIGQVLPVTCAKDYSMYELYDDRACQVYPNTGETLLEKIEELQLELARLKSKETISLYGSKPGFCV